MSTPAPMFDDIGENRAAEQGKIVAQSGRGGGEVLRTWRGAPTKGEENAKQETITGEDFYCALSSGVMASMRFRKA